MSSLTLSRCLILGMAGGCSALRCLAAELVEQQHACQTVVSSSVVGMMSVALSKGCLIPVMFIAPGGRHGRLMLPGSVAHDGATAVRCWLAASMLLAAAQYGSLARQREMLSWRL